MRGYVRIIAPVFEYPQQDYPVIMIAEERWQADLYWQL